MNRSLDYLCESGFSARASTGGCATGPDRLRSRGILQTLRGRACRSRTIPLSCKGNDYGVVGNEGFWSPRRGRAYGVEAMARWRRFRDA